MPGPSVPAVVLRGVSTILDGGVHALRGVDLTIRRSEVTVLLGPSGSGKSTLLRHINGLQSPTSGGVETLGVRVNAAAPARLRALRRRVAMIFQHFHLVGPLSALENVCAGRLGSLRGPRLGLATYPRRVRSAALEQLDRVGLADLARQRADTLSGGQQQRVAIARALMQEPELLLADEPVASLDPVTGGQVIGLLDRIAREDGLTVVCSLHQVGTALGFADRIVGLNAGRVILDSPADRLSREQALTIYDRTDPAPAPH